MMKVGFALLISAAFCYAEYAKLGDFPYFALLESEKERHCAGIILTEGLVLAPSICARKIGFVDMVVVTVGTVQIKSKENDSKRARRIMEAKEYKSDPRAKDIVFLAMIEKFEFNSNVKPATKFYDYTFDESDKNFREVGFTTKDKLPDKLENFEVKTMLYNYCSTVLSFEGKTDELSDSTICLWRNPKENKPNAGYLLTSEDGDVVGLAKYFSYSDEQPDLFILVNKYLDIINATIVQYEAGNLS